MSATLERIVRVEKSSGDVDNDEMQTKGRLKTLKMEANKISYEDQR